MAITELGSSLVISPAGIVTGTNTAVTIDAAGEKAAFIFQAPQTGSITGCMIRLNAVTTGGNFDFRLETVSGTDGNPTGILAGTNTNVTVAMSVAGAYEGTFTSPYSATRGELLAVVIVCGSPGAVQVMSGRSSPSANFPYTSHYTTSWAKSSNNNVLCLAIEYSGVYVKLGWSSCSSTVTVNVNTGSVIDEYANRINFPFACRFVGFHSIMTAGATGRDYQFTLYSSGGSNLASISPDPDIIQSIAAIRAVTYFVSTPVDLAANTDYYVALKPLTAGNITIVYQEYSTDYLKEATDFGEYFMYATRADSGAWSTNNGRILEVYPLISGIDFPPHTIS